MIIHDPIHTDGFHSENLRDLAVKIRELSDQSKAVIASGLWEKYK
jgi:hypothetical protein